MYTFKTLVTVSTSVQNKDLPNESSYVVDSYSYKYIYSYIFMFIVWFFTYDYVKIYKHVIIIDFMLHISRKGVPGLILEISKKLSHKLVLSV